jgi:thioredoxin reductase (NADPH)
LGFSFFARRWFDGGTHISYNGTFWPRVRSEPVLLKYKGLSMRAAIPENVDCAIVGAGVAGLSAALYLARFRRNVVVIDGGPSRASWIPAIHNYPGLTGLSGQQFLEDLRSQTLHYGAEIRQGRVTQIDRCGDGPFALLTGAAPLHATAVIVASGIEDNLPAVYNAQKAVRSGVLRLCPICDGYEAIDKIVACLITPETIEHALFLRTFTANLTAFIGADGRGPTENEKQVLQNASIELVNTNFEIRIDEDSAAIELDNGETRIFDALYCLTGATPQRDFLEHVAPELDISGKIITDAHQQTSVARLYAAGDVTVGLCQISVAAAEGARAASRVHSRLERVLAQ